MQFLQTKRNPGRVQSVYSSRARVGGERMTRTSHLFLKLAVFNFMLSLCLLTLDAQAQYYGSPPPADDIVLPQLNINVYGQQVIPLRELVSQRLRPGLLQGKKLERVIVRAAATSYQSRIALFINGQQVTSVRNISYQPQRLILDVPTSSYYNQNIIGQDIRSLELRVSGTVQIKRIALKVDDQLGSGQILRAHNIRLGRWVGGAEQVELSQIVRSHNPYQAVSEIRIVASSQSANSVLTVLARGAGRIDSMHLNGRGYYNTPSQKSIRVGGRTQLSDIKLMVRGDIQIQSIEVVLSNRGW